MFLHGVTGLNIVLEQIFKLENTCSNDTRPILYITQTWSISRASLAGAGGSLWAGRDLVPKKGKNESVCGAMRGWMQTLEPDWLGKIITTMRHKIHRQVHQRQHHGAPGSRKLLHKSVVRARGG